MTLMMIFRRSVAIILAITAIAKVCSAFGSAKILAMPDPLLNLKFGHLMFSVALLELAVAAICLFSEMQTLPIILIAWLATCFLAYRLGLLLVGWHRPCSCLGNLTDSIHISPDAADYIMKGVLAYLLIGSYASLFWLWRQRKKAIPASQPAQ